MAMNLNTNVDFTGRITPPSAAYPYGSSQDETVSGANDGTPYIEIRANDVFGMQQSLLASAAIVPSGTADTALLSQYVQSIVEIAAGRAVTAVEGASAVNAYIVGVSPNQQAPNTLFDGLRVEFTPAVANTGTSTLNAFGLGVKTIHLSGVNNAILAGRRQTFIYNLGIDRWETAVSLLPDANEGLRGTVEAATTAEMTAGTANKFPDAAKVKTFVDANVAVSPIKAWVNFNGVGTPSINASDNVSSLTDNAAGDTTINFTTNMTDDNYVVSGMCVGDNGTAPTLISLYSTDDATGAGMTKTVSAVRIMTKQGNSVVEVDNWDVSIAIIGN